MLPRPAVGPRQAPRGVFVADDLLLLVVVGQLAAQLHGHVGQDATGGGDVAFLDVGHWAAAAGDALEPVLHVAADRRGDVPFQVLLGLVLGVLVQLVGDVLVDRLTAAGGGEVVAHHAGL